MSWYFIHAGHQTPTFYVLGKFDSEKEAESFQSKYIQGMELSEVCDYFIKDEEGLKEVTRYYGEN
jgi:hypothetical protein